MIRRIAWTNNKMLRAVGTVAAAFLGSVILFSPINLGAQTQDPCWTNGAADQRIAACTALLASGTLSATDTIAAYNNRGRAYHAKGQDDLAIADYNAALVIDPNVAIVYTNRGNAYGGKRQYELAIADFTAALRIDPNEAYAHDNRGNAYGATGRNDLAIADFTAALRIDPYFADAYRGRGQALNARGQYDLAIADFTAALRIDPKNAFAYYSRANVYFVTGQMDLAIADHTAALNISPNIAAAYFYRGLALFVKGRIGESASDFKRTVELQPSNAYATLWLHVTRLRSGGDDSDLAVRNVSLDASKWPAPILGFYLGRRTPEQTLSAASDANQRCEALFYVAEWRLVHHEVALAQAGFTKAAATCDHSYVEYEGARAELTRAQK